MNLLESVNSGLTNYFNFNGRASRSEYWFFLLFVNLISIASLIIASLTGANGLPLIVAVASFIPSISITSRRLHDSGMSGWWQLLSFTVVGIIPLFIWYVTESDKGRNSYGENPLGKKSTFSKGSMSSPSSYASEASYRTSSSKSYDTVELYSDKSRSSKGMRRETKAMPSGMSSLGSSSGTGSKTSSPSTTSAIKNEELLKQGFKVVKKIKD